jgi:beta-phosphoglucomutase-like phosphatase (HAD superfamily)
MTVADFLRDPFGYDPESSWTGAMRRLAGKNEAAFQALKTQAMEWGGWIQERNYRSILLDNPVAAAESLRDPASVARWGWTARRYEERMKLLSGLSDESFRDELLDTMARRLAVARAIPTVRELRARLAAGRTDTDQLVVQLRSELAASSGSAGARRALERFLAATGLATLVDKE